MRYEDCWDPYVSEEVVELRKRLQALEKRVNGMCESTCASDWMVQTGIVFTLTVFYFSQCFDRY